MASKSEIEQQAMRNIFHIWGVKNSDQLDPAIRFLIESFCELIYENENSIEDISDRLLEQIANSLTPDSFVVVKPAHAIMTVMPVEPEMEIDHQTAFYTDNPTNIALRYNLRTLDFTPVADHIKLVHGEIKYLLCERNLYRMGFFGEKELVTRAGSFYQDLNRTVYVGFDLEKEVNSLKDIHLYIDFPNTYHRYDLFDLLCQTTWSIDGKQLEMETGIAGNHTKEQLRGGIFAHYNILQMSDEEIMYFYRKQFLHIGNHVRTASLEKSPFPNELIPFFPERVKDLDPQYWIKINFPPYFKKEDLEDISIHLNAFPVSNRKIHTQTLFANKSITGILPLPVSPGESFLAVETVEDLSGNQYKFLPYSDSQVPQGGTYTIKKGGLERFNTTNVKDLIDHLVDLLHSELATFTALKIDNISNSITEMEQIIRLIKNKMDSNNPRIGETPTYLLIDPEENKKEDVNAVYWTTNSDLANGLPSGTEFMPLKSIPMEKNSCFLLKATAGGKAIPRKDEMMTAYKYALASHDQLFSIRDIENFCYVKFAEKVQQVKVKRGVAPSIREKEGLIRTLDVNILAASEFKSVFDAVVLGELKLELERRSPDAYRYRILLEENTA